MIRLAVCGATGRLGRVIIELAEAGGKFSVAGGSRGADWARLVGAAQVLIDVSQPEATQVLVQTCVEQGKPLVVGTTGHSPADLESLHRASSRIPLLLAPNFSLGVNLLFWLTSQASRALGPEFDAEIVELHHRKKKDAPSGTAVRLGQIIAETRALAYDKSARHGRSGLVGERSSEEIGVHAVRAGDIVGEHTVYLAVTGERLELTHRASSRETFAHGALRAAVWLLDQPAGLYDMQDVLGLK